MMDIINLMGQPQTEEQKKKERDQLAGLMQSLSKYSRLTELTKNDFSKLMHNPTKEAEKALLGAHAK